MAKPKFPELEVTDPIEFWRSRAMKFADGLGVTSSQVNEALGIIVTAFGNDWLRATCGRKYSSAFLPRHPFTSMFNTASESAIIEVMEIAAYLKALYQIPSLGALITNLKAREQYDGALMHLAFAYRFLKAGGRGMVLEPDVDRGRKGDIYFELDDKFLVECFRERFPEQEVMGPAATRLLHDLLGAANWHKLRVRLCIRVKSSPDMEVLKHIDTAARNAIEIAKSSGSADVDDPLFQISMVPMPDPQMRGKFDQQWNGGASIGPADFGMDSVAIPRQLIGQVRDGVDVQGEAGSCGLWWWPSDFKIPEPATRVKAFATKISDKLSQTKRASDNPKRIVVAAAFEARLDEPTSKLIMKAVQHAVVPKHKDVACIILNCRVWLAKHRYGYAATILQGNTAQVFSDRLTQEFNRIETQTDILAELGS